MADYNKPLGLSVRAGIFWTSSDAAKAVEGNRWFLGGLEYKLGDLKYGSDGMNSSYSVSLDYYGKGGWSSAPVLFNVVARQSALYYSAGIGFAFTKTYSNGVSNGSNTDFAYQFTLGYDLVKGQQPLFIEGKYFGSGRPDLNGIALAVGIRF